MEIVQTGLSQIHTTDENGPRVPGSGVYYPNLAEVHMARPGALCLAGGLCAVATRRGRWSRSSVTAANQSTGRQDEVKTLILVIYHHILAQLLHFMHFVYFLL